MLKQVFNENVNDIYRNRWKAKEGDDPQMFAHDYNRWWPYHQIVDFLANSRDI